MSYCRFSSDNFACDLYCYEDCHGGFTTHVAGNRAVGDIPKVPDVLEVDFETWVAATRKQHDFLMNCQRVPIGLPHDGACFNDPDLPSFRERIVALLDLGYRGTPWLLESIDEEIKDMANLAPA